MTRWLRLLFRRDESTGLAEEIRAHIAERIDDLVESGVPAPDAWRQAHREFGELYARGRGRSRGLDWRRLWSGASRIFAMPWSRTLTKHPGSSGAVVLSVALGIGANTAIFSILDSLVLKSLPVPAPDWLVQVTPGGNYGSWTYPLWGTVPRQPECARWRLRLVGARRHVRPFDRRLVGPCERALGQREFL